MNDSNKRSQSLGAHTALFLACAAMATPAAVTADPLTRAMTSGETTIDARYRYEMVDQDGFDKDANASTLRVRLGYETGTVMGLSGFMEAEHVTSIGPENYNSTVNNEGDRPVVADPTETEVNQAYVRFQGIPDNDLKYGRQRLVLDNHRFIGNVGWRQNEQTYDGAVLVNEMLPDTTVTAAYFYNANRVFSDANPDQGNHRMRTGILNASYGGLDAGTITGYSYLLSFSDDPDLSTQTYGLRFSGDTSITDEVQGLYTLEYAYQDDYDNNRNNFNTDYYLIEGGLSMSGVTLKVGHEVLGTDNGNFVFSTPLATLHAMNGWADQFLPGTGDPTGAMTNGLRDTYVNLSGQVQGVNLMAVYHNFESDRGGIDYGTEFGLQATYALGESYTLGVKATSYDADDFGQDTDKLWLWVDASF